MSIGVKQDWYAAVSGRTQTRLFKAGDIIAMQGEAAESVGYILSGRAKAVTYSEDGTATWVGYFEAEEFFGHMSLLAETELSFEISAETDVNAIILSTAVMRDVLSREKDLGAHLAQDLARRLDMMTRRLIEAFTLSAKGRVCAELARLSNVIGIMPEQRIIRPNPVFVDVAQRVNSTRETVSRTVSDLQKRGIVKREPGALIVLSPERLKAAIQTY